MDWWWRPTLATPEVTIVGEGKGLAEINNNVLTTDYAKARVDYVVTATCSGPFQQQTDRVWEVEVLDGYWTIHIGTTTGFSYTDSGSGSVKSFNHHAPSAHVANWVQYSPIFIQAHINLLHARAWAEGNNEFAKAEATATVSDFKIP